MRNAIFALACISALLAPEVSRAKTPIQLARELVLAELEGTQAISFKPVVTNGTLTGCTLVFDALHKDVVYRNGDFIVVSGHVGILKQKGGLFASMKIVVNEMNTADPTQGLKPSAPSRLYLVGPNFETNLSTLIGGKSNITPGSRAALFQSSPTVDWIFAGMDANRITVGFNSRSGSTDIQLPIELDVVEIKDNGQQVRSVQPKIDFMKCVQTLATAALADLPQE